MLVRYGPRHNLPLAQKELQEALGLNPGLSRAWLALADPYYLSGSYDQAIEQGARVLRREPNNYRAHLILRECLLQKGAWEAAAGELRIARRIAPEDPAPAYGVGRIAAFQKDSRRALSHYEEALRLDRQRVDLLEEVVSLHLQERGSQGALDRCLSQLSSSPGNPWPGLFTENRWEASPNKLGGSGLPLINNRPTSGSVWDGHRFDTDPLVGRSFTIFPNPLTCQGNS